MDTRRHNDAPPPYAGASEIGTALVGRSEELRVFAEALRPPTWPFRVLYVFGPGGVGKTSLLLEYRRAAERAGIRWVQVDARDLRAVAADVEEAVTRALGLADGAEPGRHALAIDSCERLAAIEPWLSGPLLRNLPDAISFVVSSRRSPSPAWSVDGGWRRLRTVRLANLSSSAARLYVEARGIPERSSQAVLDAAEGHPLTLTLACDAAERCPDGSLHLEALAGEVLQVLFDPTVEGIDSAQRRGALEISAVVGRVDEDLLAHLAGSEGATELFVWLRGLSCVTAAAWGLSLLEPMRRLLCADLEWRNPVRYASLVERARAYLLARLEHANRREEDRLLTSWVELAPCARGEAWTSSGPGSEPSASVAPLENDDRGAVLSLARELEGAEAADRMATWLDAAPETFASLRMRGEMAGFLLELPLGIDAAPSDAEGEVLAPLARDAQHLLREGENATFVRAWMARSLHQAPSAVTRRLLLELARRRAGAAPAITYLTLVEGPDASWAGVFKGAGATRVPAADFTVSEVTHRVWRHDWRRGPTSLWLRAIAGFDERAPVCPSPPSLGRAAARVLDRTEFYAAVRQALRDFAHPDALEASPLLVSRVVMDRAASRNESAKDALLALVVCAAGSLQSSPRRMKLHRALLRTYFEPAETQEQAAELLGLPFSTYRRHLRAAIDHVAEVLWRAELGGVRPSA